ncbi:MAG: hypothetical protein WAS07_12465, partial [Micropruina sp.]
PSAGQYPQAPWQPVGPPTGHLPPGAYPPGPGAPVPPKKGGSRTLIWIGAGVVLLIVLGLVFGSGLLNRIAPASNPVRTTSSGATVTPPGPAGLASDTVRGYLEALALGNAEQALEHAAERPSDSTFLTAEVLAATNAAAPITAVDVTPSLPGAAGPVTASFMVGSTSVTAAFRVTKVDGVFKLVEVAQEVDLSRVAFDSLPLRLAGVAVTSPTLYLFPGFYPATTSTSYATYGKGLLIRPQLDASASALKPSVTSAGIKAVRAAAKKKLSACLKVNSLAPKGCRFGIRIPSSTTIRKSTISWKVISGSFDKIKPRMVSGDPALITATFSIRLRFDGRDTVGRSWFGYANLHTLSTDISRSTLQVTFD